MRKIKISVAEIAQTELCVYINNLKIKQKEKDKLFSMIADFSEKHINSYYEELEVLFDKKELGIER